MFGTYLHHLSSHASIQYEIIALSSANTEADQIDGKVSQKPKPLNPLGRELLASEASSRLLLIALSFQGNMGGMTCSKPVKPHPHKGR